MNIVLNRSGGVPLREQLAVQFEVKILAGELGPGERLPSVRELARTLGLHPNTVSAAYRSLQEHGHTSLERGVGVFVRGRGGTSLETARGLDEMIRVALATAFRKGFSVPAVRASVERWLRAAPPTRIVVADPCREMAELLAHELGRAVEVPVEPWTLQDLEQIPMRAEGALALALPYHIDRLRRLPSSPPVESVALQFAADDRQLLARLPAGAMVVVVSHAPTLLTFAAKLISSLRGDELLVSTHLVTARGWRRVAPAADLVFADTLALPRVAALSPRRLRPVLVLPERSLQRVRRALQAALTPRQD
jgi:DNA-binding transcriptional regulator YhcF (GntR family)